MPKGNVKEKQQFKKYILPRSFQNFHTFCRNCGKIGFFWFEIRTKITTLIEVVTC